jgi:AcrR family transcriptional regulator
LCITGYRFAVSGPESFSALLTRSLSAPAGTDEPTAERIVDATVEELRVRGLRGLTVEGVAGRAGVSRITVYRHFGDRDGLLEHSLARETRRFLAAVAAADDASAPPVSRIAATFGAAVTAARRHPLVGHWLVYDPGELVTELLADDAQVLKTGTAFVAEGLRVLTGAGATLPHPERLAEVLVRLFTALIVLPPPSVDLDDPAQVQELARDVIAPIVMARQRSRSAPPKRAG